jgi:hypothetical protein
VLSSGTLPPENDAVAKQAADVFTERLIRVILPLSGDQLLV